MDLQAKTPSPLLGAQSIARAVTLLEVVAKSGEAGMRLIDVSSTVGLHTATTRRILQALVAAGFLAFDVRRRLYTTGPAIFSFAVMGSPWFSRRDYFLPALEAIAAETGDTVLLSLRSGTESVCLMRREGQYPIRVMSLDAGARRPLGAGSGSLAILAFLPDADRDYILKANEALYPAFGLTAAEIAAMIIDTRKFGFSFNEGRIVDGVYGVGVPILGAEGAVAAISVAAIAARLGPKRRAEIVTIIRDKLSRVPGVHIPQVTSG